ncbi:MAG TPA: putative PEP-binding protein, partial [Anaeromyxobacteraceae bacterium]|nr:putative PEP-binding protein [Anaeromyxobacteraceae bacterium]
PPLHEFLPHDDAGAAELARATGKSVERVKQRIADLHESNPMLGHRGCRLGISYPEITEMQSRAILEAACEVAEEGIDVKPEIMIPLVGHRKELENQERIVRAVAEQVFADKGRKVKYLVGTMIEVPRGALTADEIAKTAEFFSFGTNDLTQTTYGISRDDVGTVLASYKQKDIYDTDPFVSVDRSGVGELMKIAVAKGRSTRPNIKLGICGEHGGDPRSVEFCHEIGLDYVSCSPYRIPIARLAAGQAALKEAKGAKAATAKVATKAATARTATAKAASKVASKVAPVRAKARAALTNGKLAKRGQAASAKAAKVGRTVAPVAKSVAKSAMRAVSKAVKTARGPAKKSARGRARA